MAQPGQDFNFDVIGQWSDPVTFSVTKDATIAYAEATNDDAAPHIKGDYAPPVFAIVPVTNIMAERTMSAVPDELIMRILHGEQDMRFHRPIGAGDELSCRAKVVGIHGRSSGVVVTTLLETRDQLDELVNEQYFTGFFRGGVLEGGQGEEPPAHAFDEALCDRGPDATVVQKFDDDQTFRYSEAAGDPMPIHLDDDFAKAMGLPGIIIHGLCTMAFNSRAVIETACPEDPSRLKRLVVRFSAPAQPKHTITTELWKTSDSSYAFQTVTDEGTFVIKDGLAEIAPALKEKL
ncbi:MAG TPA: MaoC/PaaZ C-terminal domain-containing protein [Nocardioidaceae bacterium]|nr:MaoC/PaaZ C-terminal domain-containing protein [Nocardioidaceae bacterium]